MLPLLAAPLAFKISLKFARVLLKAGLSLSLAGSLVLLAGAVYIYVVFRSKQGAQRPQRNREKASLLVGFGLLAVGLFFQMLGTFTLTLRQ